MYNLVRYLQDIGYVADQIDFSITAEDGYLVMSNIYVTILDDISNASYVEHRDFERIAENITRETQSGCTIEVKFLGEDLNSHDSWYIEAGDGLTRLKKLPIDDDDKELLAKDLDNLYINFSADEEGVTITELMVSDRLRQSKDISKNINKAIRMTVNKNDYLMKSTPST